MQDPSPGDAEPLPLLASVLGSWGGPQSRGISLLCQAKSRSGGQGPVPRVLCSVLEVAECSGTQTPSSSSLWMETEGDKHRWGHLDGKANGQTDRQLSYQTDPLHGTESHNFTARCCPQCLEAAPCQGECQGPRSPGKEPAPPGGSGSCQECEALLSLPAVDQLFGHCEAVFH